MMPLDYKYNYLALGDSYTIGTSVELSDSYPAQLQQRFNQIQPDTLHADVVAVNGWTTADLLNGIEASSLRSSYDVVTLLIGVNNIYQELDFGKFKKELDELLEFMLGKGVKDAAHIIVMSIPDYSFTPFGQRRPNVEGISGLINKYNKRLKQRCSKRGMQYLNITDISRRGLEEPILVAEDDLHLSRLAYTECVDRLYPMIKPILEG